MCDTLRRHKSRRHGRYDINGFITQLLASRRFDELAEKLAEKAANKIMNIKGDQTHVDRASDYNDTESLHNTQNLSEEKYEIDREQLNTQNQSEDKYEIGREQLNTQNQSEEIHEKGLVQLTKSFAGKVDPEAIINETILLTENLKLKYKYLKKNAEKKIKDQRELASKNVTNEDLLKQNKTMRMSLLVDGEHTSAKKTERQIAELNATQQIQNKIIEPVDENKRITDNIKGISFHSGNDAERKENKQKDDPREPSLVQEPINLNSGAEIKEQEPNHVENAIKEDIASSLDEQNQQYVPSAEKTNTEVDKSDEKTQEHARKESVEFGNAIAYFRGREKSVEENKVPESESYKPSPYDGVDRSAASNEGGDRGSQEQAPEDESSREKTDEEPVTPVIRREGDKVYTYVQDPEYKDYHEEMAKWQKEHPENPADFL